MMPLVTIRGDWFGCFRHSRTRTRSNSRSFFPTIPPMEPGFKRSRSTSATNYEVGYELFSINGKTLGAGEPIRVKQGERVLPPASESRFLRRDIPRWSDACQ